MEQKQGITVGIRRDGTEGSNTSSPVLNAAEPQAMEQTKSKRDEADQNKPYRGPKTVGRQKEPTELEKRVAQLAAQRDAAERAYQEELAKARRKHAVGYIRVSTTAQANDDKYGPEVQRDAIIAYADQNNFVIDRWFYDTASGIKESRPALDQILYDQEVMNPPIEAVIAFKSDRIARDIKLYFYYLFILEKRGIKLLSVKEQFEDDPYGLSAVYRALMLFVAEQERKNIAMRTGGGRATKARAGGYCGGNAPYGYANARGTGRLEVNEREAEMVRTVFKYLDKGWPMEDIADELEDQGYRTRSGKRFRYYHIRSIRDNRKFYEGYYHYGDMDTWVKGVHTPILEPIAPLYDEFDKPNVADEDNELKNRPL